MYVQDDAKDGQQQADERASPARGGDGSAAGEEGGAGGAGVAVGVPNLLSADLQFGAQPVPTPSPSNPCSF